MGMTTTSHTDVASTILASLASQSQNESRTILAKLLAREDIIVNHDPNAETAYFNGETRVLTMPMWIGMSEALSDMLVAHEVGHALHTPEGSQPVIDAMKRVDPKGSVIAKTYLNVVEDARIEREIKSEFPGTKRCFAIGYRELFDKNFFDLSAMPMNQRTLIDRINIHAKIGTLVSVPFTDYERGFVDAVMNTRDWNEVVELSREIWDYDAAEKTRKQQEQLESGNGPESDEGDEDGQESPEGDSGGNLDGDSSPSDESPESQESSEDGTNADGEKNESANDSSDSNQGGKHSQGVSDSSPDAPKSVENFERMMQGLRDREAAPRNYAIMPTPDLDRIVIGRKDLDVIFGDWNRKMPPSATRVLDLATEIFLRENDKQVKAMVREFERRRAANASRRTRIGTRGVLNVNRVHAYKFSEDIFKTHAVTRDGQSHGIVMFVDWSSSMSSVFADTINQTLSLASFCHKARIPFVVYGFSSELPWRIRGNSNSSTCWSRNSGDLNGIDFSLIELISSDLNRKDFLVQVRNLIGLSSCVGGQHNPFVVQAQSRLGSAGGTSLSVNLDPSCRLGSLRLGGTPLNSAILAAHDILPEFRNRTRVQVLTSVFLTDGGATDRILNHTWENSQPKYYAPTPGCGNWNIPIFARHRNSKNYIATNHSSSNLTDGLLNSLRDHARSRVLGIEIKHSSWSRMIDRSGTSVIWDVARYLDHADGTTRTNEEKVAMVRKAESDNVLIVPKNEASAYDSLYIMSSKSMSFGEASNLDSLDSGASLTRIRNAFLRQFHTGRVSRVFLNHFVPMVSENI